VELELGQVSRERGDLSNQLSSLAQKKEALNEEVMRIRQRLEQANETNARLNRDLEDLVKEKEEKQVKHKHSASVDCNKLFSSGIIFKSESRKAKILG
jgi:chromosome segregation ATPase